MDPLRQLRFVIPPLFLYGSLFVGKLLTLNFSSIQALESDPIVALVQKLPTATVVAIGGAFGVMAFPLGWLIGAFGLAVMRLAAFVVTMRHPQVQEAWLRNRNWKTLMEHLGATDERPYHLQALTTFVHSTIHSGIGSWLQRRWNSFHLSLHAASALIIAVVVGPTLSISRTGTWLWGTAISVAVLLFHSLVAYWETMRMFEFQIEHATFADDKKK